MKQSSRHVERREFFPTPETARPSSTEPEIKAVMQKNHWTYRDFYNVAVKGFPRLGIGSIDVTYRCNLNCKHCYFKEQGYENEQPLSFWIDKFNELKRNNFPFLICGWLGGEPLLRPEIIEYGRNYFKSNVIFTNGTIELPNWPESTFVVGVHGNAACHSATTGTDEKVYHAVKKNASRPDLRVFASFCVTPWNQYSIEPFVEEWKDTGIAGVTYEFYTPTKSPMDRELSLSWEERDKVLARVKKLRDKYGEFIHNTPVTLKLMHSSKSRELTRHCPFIENGFSFDPMGKEKEQCTLGPNADCERCGCILPFYSEILHKRQFLFSEFFHAVGAQIKAYLRGEPSFHLMKGSHK